MSETYQGLITITDLTDNKACEIRGVNVFKYNENGEIPSASSAITLTAILSDNISGSNWQYKNSLGNFVDFSPITTSDTITINHTDDIFINDIATIKKLTSDESVFDIFTITKIRDGSPGAALINASLSNDNQTIPCDGNGIPFESSFPINSKITVYEGAEDITNKYSISVTIQSDSGVPRLIGSITGDTFTATSWNALSQSYYTATVTFTCTRTGYPPINKVLTLSKVTTGSSPNYYELTYDILATNKNISNIFNPSSVTFRANHINGELTEDYQGYLKLYRVKLDGTQETIITSNMSSDGASGYKYTYTFSQTLDANTKYLLAELYKTDGVGDYLDKQSIIVTSDGQTGASPINIVLGNVADVIPCDVDGKLKTDLIINIPFTAYKGTSQISATINKSNITTRPSNLTDDNITITSSTDSSSGNIQFKLYAGSELGNNSGEITLTFTCDGKQVPMKYGWSKSIQAPPGADGKTYYTWIKYADSPTSGMSDNPSGKAYIGIAHNKTSETESTTYSDYTWSLIKGETGADGNGITTIKQYYAKTTTFSKPSAESITSTTMPELDNTYRYLWMKEVISFTKSENQTVITLIAARGDNGEMSPEQVAQLNKASQDASDAVSKVDNLEIGGRNLLKQYIRAGRQCVKIDDLTVKVGTEVEVADTYFYLRPHCALTAGETYTISCEASNVPDGCNWSFGVRAEHGAWQLYINKNGKIFATGVLDADVDADTDLILDDMYGRPSTAPNIILTNFKLEKGNKATDWTPAPEDVDAGIANAAKVATNFLGYDSTNGLIIGNKTSGTWSGYRSQILPGSFNVLDASSTVLASFGPTTVIGEEANANMHLTFNNLSMVDRDGTKFFEVGDARNADGIATIKHTAKVTVKSNGSATVTVNSNISSIVSVYADSVQLSSSSYSFSQKDVTINGLTANSKKTIEIAYTTTESTVYLTFGERDSSGNIGNYSVSEGYMTTASGYASHAEGELTTASGLNSHAEGWKTIASGNWSHAEGWKTIASGLYSHAEGEWTEATDSNSHAEGYNTTASGHCSHAEGAHTVASGSWSHAGGHSTVADNNYMTAIGQYNTKNSGKAFVIGNGYDDKTRSNAFAVSWAGSVDIAYNIFMELGACYIRDNTFDKTLSVIDGATTLDGLLAQAIINTFSYADAIEILGEEITGRNANINVKKLLQKIVENQRVSYMSIGLSSNKTVSISETWKWVTLPLDSIRGSSGLFASSTISNNCIVIPKDGIYRLSGVFSTKNGAYCSISVNREHVGVAGIQPQTTFASAPIGMTIQRLKKGDMVGLLIEKSSSSNPTVAGANYTHLLVEKIG